MSNFKTVLKKELLDLMRDKKSIIVMILIPLILYPTMFKLIAVTTKDIEDVNNQINVSVIGDINSELKVFLSNQEGVLINETSDALDSLKNGVIQVVIKISDNFDLNILQGIVSDVEVIYDKESNKSTLACARIAELIEDYKLQFIKRTLVSSGINENILSTININIKSNISATDTITGKDATLFLGMIPSMIVMFMVSATISIAADLGAGEKERLTFEPLLSTPANRISILWAKIVSLSIMAVVTLISNITSILISMKLFTNDGDLIESAFTIKSLLYLSIICSILLIVLATLQMCVSIYARSAKEAGTYLSTIMIPIMLLSFLPNVMDNKNMIMFNIPITNSVSLMKEFLIGIYNIKHILVVLLWHIIYILFLVKIINRIFLSEDVIFRV